MNDDKTTTKPAVPGIDIPSRYRALLELDPAYQLLQYSGEWTTIGQIAKLAAQLDALLSDAEFGESAKVALLTRNRPLHVSAIVGILSSGRCLVPVTSIQTDAATIGDLERSGAAVLVADDEDWERAGIVIGCRDRGVMGIRIRKDDVCMVDATLQQPTPMTTAPGVAVLMPTSGTTGIPKRIPYTYAQLGGALGRVAKYSPATARALGGELQPRRGTVIAALTMAHVAGFWTVLQALAEGRSIALLDRFDANAWADLVAEHRVALSMIPPSALIMVLDAGIAPEKLGSLKAIVCGTAALDPAVGEAFKQRFGVPVLTAYGATEFPGGIVGWSLEDYHQFHASKARSAGRARPGIKIKIVDQDTGEDLPPDRDGLIAVFSPQATIRTLDGWVRTNDIGRLDADGFLYVLGRADDAINRGGFKVVPQVVEEVIRAHPAVIEAAVVGLPDRRLGQVPVAAVELREPVEPADLLAWVRERLAKYQVPVTVVAVDRLPRTASMKVSKQAIRELLSSQATTTR